MLNPGREAVITAELSLIRRRRGGGRGGAGEHPGRKARAESAKRGDGERKAPGGEREAPGGSIQLPAGSFNETLVRDRPVAIVVGLYHQVSTRLRW